MTHDQCLEALSKANYIRLSRARIKREIAAGSRSWRRTILQPPEVTDTMRLVELMCACPRFGIARAEKACRRLQISAHRKIGDLTARQRIEIAQYMDDNAPVGAWKTGGSWGKRKQAQQRREEHERRIASRG